MGHAWRCGAHLWARATKRASRTESGLNGIDGRIGCSTMGTHQSSVYSKKHWWLFLTKNFCLFQSCYCNGFHYQKLPLYWNLKNGTPKVQFLPFLNVIRCCSDIEMHTLFFLQILLLKHGGQIVDSSGLSIARSVVLEPKLRNKKLPKF